MRVVNIPEPEFSPWFNWEDRRNYEQCDLPGIYLLSITENQNLAGEAPAWGDVSYIGMTRSRGGLANRWFQFDQTIRGKRGHSGGKTVRKQLGLYGSWTQLLYVAAFAIECNTKSPEAADYLRIGWIAFLEYEALSRFREAMGTHPRYNTM